MKAIILTNLLLLTSVAVAIPSHGQSWKMTAKQYNHAPFNDSIGDYYPWQESWIDCEIPITCDSLGESLDSTLITYQIKILKEKEPQIINMVDFVIEGDITIQDLGNRIVYGSPSFDQDKELAGTYIVTWIESDTIEVWQSDKYNVLYIYRGVKE